VTHEQHIQPDEIDLILDGDEGFATHPRRKHLEACAECRDALDRAREVNALLESLPHMPARPDFASSVMAKVQVFEPWYVTLGDTVQRMIPQRGPWRVATSLGLGGAAVSVTAIAIWVSLKIDLAIYAVQMAGTRLQTESVSAAGSLVSTMFGEQALTVLRDGGTPALFIAATVFLATLAGATFGLRRLLVSARRRGS
jgi:hypothetical protein